ncbi:MAG: biopolymer transporter ExbD [Rickettsiales bacterium]|nr:biopolymer transporter ExbD [Rickettsiales bacterium]
MIHKVNYSSISDRRARRRVNAHINVTPFIDVVLVLLIVFMISAPLMVSGVNVSLPSNNSAKAITSETPFTLTVQSSGKIFFEDKNIKFSEVKNFIKENVLSVNNRIYIRGDKDVSYGDIMKIIAEINSIGYNKVSLVTESDIN